MIKKQFLPPIIANRGIRGKFSDLRKRRRFWLAFLAIGVAVGALGFALPAQAGVGELFGGVVFFIIRQLVDLISVFTTWAMMIAGTLLDYVTSANFNNQPLTHGHIVDIGWSIVRDFANMFFIVILLASAFATMLSLENYNIRKILPTLVIIALLVNFTKVIAGIFVDAAQIIMIWFLTTDGGGSISLTLVHGVGLGQFFTLNGQAISQMTFYQSQSAQLVNSIAYVIFSGYFAMILFFLSVMLILRIAVLWILVIFSPLAFVSYILPNAKFVFDNWWKYFLNYTFFGPIMAFFLFLAVIIAVQIDDLQQWVGYQASDGASVQSTFLTGPFILKYLVVMIFLWRGYKFSQQMSIWGADWGAKQMGKIGNAAKTWGLKGINEGAWWGMSRLGSFPGMRKLANNRLTGRKNEAKDEARTTAMKNWKRFYALSEDDQKKYGNEEKYNKAMSKKYGAANRDDYIEKMEDEAAAKIKPTEFEKFITGPIGKKLIKLRPKIIKKGIANYLKDQDERVYSEAEGAIYDMTAWVASGFKRHTTKEMEATQRLVDKQEKEWEVAGGEDPKFWQDRLRDSVKANDAIGVRASLKRIFIKEHENSIFQNPEIHALLSNDLQKRNISGETLGLAAKELLTTVRVPEKEQIRILNDWSWVMKKNGRWDVLGMGHVGDEELHGKALKQQKEWFSRAPTRTTLMNFNPYSLFEINKNGEVVRVSDSGAALLGAVDDSFVKHASEASAKLKEMLQNGGRKEIIRSLDAEEIKGNTYDIIRFIHKAEYGDDFEDNPNYIKEVITLTNKHKDWLSEFPQKTMNNIITKAKKAPDITTDDIGAAIKNYKEEYQEEEYQEEFSTTTPQKQMAENIQKLQSKLIKTQEEMRQLEQLKKTLGTMRNQGAQPGIVEDLISMTDKSKKKTEDFPPA